MGGKGGGNGIPEGGGIEGNVSWWEEEEEEVAEEEVETEAGGGGEKSGCSGRTVG